ncbi:MAG: response regulator transcription factor [Candidatus Eisenbacteria bacterium]|nr:response regulator transcription factor [Candidatus Eisenbacteria bacterium]
MKILVVDDDLELLNLISFALRQAGYMVVRAADGPAALKVFDEEMPDLVVLDFNLPGLNGLEVLVKIREKKNTTPVMMLTVRSAEEDLVQALDHGADDYLTKPFSPRTLLARIRALLRRTGIEKPAPLLTGDFALDTENRQVSIRGGKPVPLTPLEFRLLQLLVTNTGYAVPTERITSHVWGYRGSGDRFLLKQLVHRLRRKIETDPTSPDYLITIPGIGYRFLSGADPEEESV